MSQLFQDLVLNTTLIGKHIQWFDRLDSTNAYISQKMNELSNDGYVIGAEAQRMGRGRLDRQWQSQAGLDLTFSILLYPKIPLKRLSVFSIITPLAIAEAIETVVGEENSIDIKWPNDLQMGGKKIGGILIESKILPIGNDRQKSTPLIIGMGLNVNSQIENQGSESLPDASSLKASFERELSRKSLLEEILNQLDTYYLELQNATDNLSEIIKRYVQGYKNRLRLLNHPISIQVGKDIFSGTAIDIDHEFALCVRLEDGSIQKFRAEQSTIIR